MPTLHAYAQAVVYCKRLSAVAFAGCSALGTLLMWSDQLTALSLQDCLACPGTPCRSVHAATAGNGLLGGFCAHPGVCSGVHADAHNIEVSPHPMCQGGWASLRSS